jgi:hypothetical protein
MNRPTINLSEWGKQGAALAERMSDTADGAEYQAVLLGSMVFLHDAICRVQEEGPLPPSLSHLLELLGQCIGETEGAFQYFEQMEKQPS